MQCQTFLWLEISCLNLVWSECHYGACHYVECHYDDCHYALVALIKLIIKRCVNVKYVPFSMCNVQFEMCNVNNQLLKILHDFLERFDDYLMIL